jgi:hypothetical protein
MDSGDGSVKMHSEEIEFRLVEILNKISDSLEGINANIEGIADDINLIRKGAKSSPYSD